MIHSDRTWSDNVVHAWTMEVVTAHWFVRVVDHLLTNAEHGGEKDPVLKHPIQVRLSRNRRSTERPAKSEVTFSTGFFRKKNSRQKKLKTQGKNSKLKPKAQKFDPAL